MGNIKLKLTFLNQIEILVDLIENHNDATLEEANCSKKK